MPIVGGFAGLPDTRIHYQIYGGGPPLVLIHGNGEDMRVFDGILDRLAPRYRVITLDTRGHGKSERGERPLDFDTIASDIAGVLQLLEVPRAHVVGYSDGGNAALHLALFRREKVGGLVLLGSNYSPSGMTARYRAPITLAWALGALTAQSSKEKLRKWELLNLMAANPRLRLDALTAITAPTLVIAAERDMIKPEHTRAMADAIPGARMELVPCADHFNLHTCEHTVGLILEFLDGMPL